MKYVQVQVTKTIGGGMLQWGYPEGYDKHQIAIEAYEHSGDPAKGHTDEFLYGMADDTFTEAAGVTVMDKAMYDEAVAVIKASAAALAM